MFPGYDHLKVTTGFSYIHIITISKKKGHGFKWKLGRVDGAVWKEERRFYDVIKL